MLPSVLELLCFRTLTGRLPAQSFRQSLIPPTSGRCCSRQSPHTAASARRPTLFGASLRAITTCTIDPATATAAVTLVDCCHGTRGWAPPHALMSRTGAFPFLHPLQCVEDQVFYFFSPGWMLLLMAITTTDLKGKLKPSPTRISMKLIKIGPSRRYIRMYPSKWGGSRSGSAPWFYL